MQNIELSLGKGFTFSMSQGVGAGSFKGHHVEIALLKEGQIVNTCYWYHCAAYHEDMEDYYDDVIAHVSGTELAGFLAKAYLYVEAR
jgi:hypothetical protein